MREVLLITKAGAVVATVGIGPFSDAGMPDVVVWGSRIFTRFAAHPDDAKVWTYAEASVAKSFTPPPGLR